MNANRLGILVVVSAIAAQTLLLQSCSSFLEEYSQDNDYVRTWNDLDELLIGNCYMPVVEGEAFSAQANYGSFLHYLADELEENNTPYMGEAAAYDDSRSWAFGYFTWQQRVGQNDTYTDFYQENKTWTKVYNLINVANNIIESVNDVPSSTDEEQQGVHKVRGEAHFLRAFYYFWLANIYGQPYNPATAAADLAVPLKTSEAVEDIKFSRASVQTVYDQVVRDLQTAETELAQVRAKQTSLYRADVTAVRLLFSRVYLYLQQWEQAATYAAKVIEAHPQLQDIVATTTAKFAVASNPENLFSMGGDDAPCLCYYGYQSFRISDDLYNAYGSNDNRRRQWFWHKGLFTGSVKHEEGNKYTDQDPANKNYYNDAYYEGYRGVLSPVSSLFLLRSAEAYLNLAEAEAYQGHSEPALQALNALRSKRYNAGATLSGLTQADLITAIRHERRLELALEGHRWFDLRRYRVCGVQPERISIVHDYTIYESRTSINMLERHRFTLTEDDASWTLPIPEEVITFNTGMPNNGNQWRTYETIAIN